MKKIKPIFHQYSCREQNRPDYRQANAVLKHAPDIIIFEMPEEKGNASSVFNKYAPESKPREKIAEIRRDLLKTAAHYGYARSDARVWKNIEKIWNTGQNILLYNVDAPREYRSEWFEVWQHMYPCALKNWIWWTHIYIRERIMANHIEKILRDYKGKQDPVVLVFLQSFHWTHVQFLLKKPTRKQIGEYYFGKFSSEIKQNEIASRLKKLNPIFYKYWVKYSDF